MKKLTLLSVLAALTLATQTVHPLANPFEETDVLAIPGAVVSAVAGYYTTRSPWLAKNIGLVGTSLGCAALTVGPLGHVIIKDQAIGSILNKLAFAIVAPYITLRFSVFNAAAYAAGRTIGTLTQKNDQNNNDQNNNA